jgi:hypothetical protein
MVLVQRLAVEMGGAFKQLSLLFAPALLRLASCDDAALSAAAGAALHAAMQQDRSAVELLPALAAGAASPRPAVRRMSLTLVHVALQRHLASVNTAPAGTGPASMASLLTAKTLDSVENAIRCGIMDSDAQTHEAALACFLALADGWFARAQAYVLL